MRALTIQDGFHQHYFFDLDERRTLRLKQATKGQDDVSIRVGGCSPMICGLVPDLRSRNVRGVAFLDPYGPHLEWRILEALADTGTMEVVVNFPLAMAINRLITKSGSVPDNWSLQLTKCFGTKKWREVAYERETDLFGREVTSRNEGVPERLLD